MNVSVSELQCLLVDLQGRKDFAALSALVESSDQMSLKVQAVSGAQAAIQQLDTGRMVAMVIFCSDATGPLQHLLKAYQERAGGVGEFQAIVCSDPSPEMALATFEYGVDQFFSEKDWVVDLSRMLEYVKERLQEEGGAEIESFRLAQAIRRGDMKIIQETSLGLKEMADYDFRAAFSHGKGCEATGDLEGAITAYQSARSLNKAFRPGGQSAAETLMLMGRFDEALAIFQKLDASNPSDSRRKASMATAYALKGDKENAEKMIVAAKALAQDDPLIEEARAHLLLRSGKVGEAMALLDNLPEVGPLLAARLNDVGVKLSKSGKGRAAMALYDKAHRIVRPDLRYKISMNAALASRRLGDYDGALGYLKRCEEEFGGSFVKLERVRQAIVKERSQKSPKAAG